MKGPMISADRVLELIGIYGSDPSAWPEDERVQAQRLIKADPDFFSKALEKAQSLDSELSKIDVPNVPLGLTDAILANAPDSATVPTKKHFLRFFFPQEFQLPVGAALASLCVGAVTSYSYAGGADFDAHFDSGSAYIQSPESSFDDWLNGMEDGQ